MSSNNTNYWDRPEPPEDFFERIEKSFQQYMFFENLPGGMREFTCTSCHSSFRDDPLERKRTITPDDIELWRAKVNDDVICPKCHNRCTLKNVKLLKHFPSQQRCTIALLVDAYDDVWLRCYISYKDGKRGDVNHHEVMFYHLVDGDSYEFKSWSLDGPLQRIKTIENPFTWHHGLYTEQYDYFVDNCGNSFDNTFLKYALPSKMSHCVTKRKYYCIPDVKFLCWFARHPQFEFLMKLGHVEVVHEIIEKHTDFSSLLDWSAKKPWELFKLSHEEYKVWKKYDLDFSVYKVFRRLKIPGEKGFELSSDILDLCSNNRWFYSVNEAYRFISRCKKVKTSPSEIYKYVEKVHTSSRGGCSHCPGITFHNAYTLWCDYIDLAVGAGKLKGINPMPKDLKVAHDQMLAAKKQYTSVDWTKVYKKHLKDGESYAERFNKKFPKVEKIYKNLADKYSYESDKYIVVVPRSIQEIYAEAAFLRLCVVREGVTRYWERVSKNESYMFFLRNKEAPDKPFYLLEVEPGGTIRQKRSFDDLQYDDIKCGEAVEFLKEWQKVVRERLTANDKKLAQKSKKQREKDMQELRDNKVRVRSGFLTGQLLADVLSADLLEIDIEDIQENENNEEKRKIS